MKCPKCSREMSDGFLYAKDMITWAPELLPFGLSVLKNDAVNVSSVKYVSTHNIPALICKNCQLILADYSKR